MNSPCCGPSVSSPDVLALQWCEQTVPACGSYQQNLVGLLLPAFAQAISAEENGQTKEEALGDVMPPLLQVCSSVSSSF